MHDTRKATLHRAQKASTLAAAALAFREQQQPAAADAAVEAEAKKANTWLAEQGLPTPSPFDALQAAQAMQARARQAGGLGLGGAGNGQLPRSFANYEKALGAGLAPSAAGAAPAAGFGLPGGAAGGGGVGGGETEQRLQTKKKS